MKTLLAVLALGACADPGDVQGDVSYDDRFGDSTTMDIHLPAGAGEARPAVMLIHGGAWEYGDKSDYTEAAERYAAAGYVAATINYRLLPARYPADAQDCLCALSFLRANAALYGIDPARIAVTGYSAGGHLSALVGTAWDEPMHQPDCAWGPTGAPAAVIPGDGIYDHTKDPNPWIVDLAGASLADRPDIYRALSPLSHVRAGLPPFLVVHGHDDVVAVEGASALVDALRATGNDVLFLHLDGAGHVLSPSTASEGVYLQAATDMPEAWAATLDFLDQTVGAR
jgi:acetyl esterase/lipase